MRASTRFARPASRSGCQVRDADPARSPRPAVPPSLTDPRVDADTTPRAPPTRRTSPARARCVSPGGARRISAPHPRREPPRSLQTPSPPFLPPPPLTPSTPHPQPRFFAGPPRPHRRRSSRPGTRRSGRGGNRGAPRAPQRRRGGWRFANRNPPADGSPSRKPSSTRRGRASARFACPGRVRNPARRTPPPPPPPRAAIGGSRSSARPADRAPRRRPLRGLALVPDALMPEVMAHDHRAATLRRSAPPPRARRRPRRGGAAAAFGTPRSPASSARSPCGARRGRARTARGPTSKPTRSRRQLLWRCVMRGGVPGAGDAARGTPTRRGSAGLTDRRRGGGRVGWRRGWRKRAGLQNAAPATLKQPVPFRRRRRGSEHPAAARFRLRARTRRARTTAGFFPAASVSLGTDAARRACSAAAPRRRRRLRARTLRA